MIIIQHNFSDKVERKVTKTSRRRKLPLFDDMADMITALPRLIDSDHVFHAWGRPYNEKLLGEHWRRACRTLRIEGVTLYAGTRHSAASQLYNRGVSLDVIRELLGHTTAKMTMRYSHATVDTLRREMLRDAKVIKADFGGSKRGSE